MKDPGRLLVVGGASLDVLHFAGRTERSPGGAGLYTALAAARAGASVTMFAPRPAPMPVELEGALARLEWVGPAVAPEELPRFEIVTHEDGRTEIRSLFWGAEARLRPEDAPDPREGWVYCVPFADPALQLAFLRHFKARGRRVACGTYAPLADAHTALVREALSLADAFFCNEAELRTLATGAEGLQVPAGRLLFVTRGARGARVQQGAHTTDVPGAPARLVEPTGAGDTFCGTVLARLAQGDHPVEAARHGVLQAAETVGEVGPAALLSEGAAPLPPLDPRVRLDEGRLASLATLLGRLPEVRPFDFVSDLLPPVGHEGVLDFFFAATLQQFGFWTLEGEGYGAPMVATLDGRALKGSDYLWAAYRRWLQEDPRGLAPEGQRDLDASSLAGRMRDDAGGLPLPAPELHLQAARAYGRDLLDLGRTPRLLVREAAVAPSPVQALLGALDQVGGYKEDPLRKKSALLALILRERPEGFLPRLSEDIPPVVDYHVQRSLLRLGLLAVEDDALRARLRARARVEAAEEEAVRRAAFAALERLSTESGRSMAACDFFLFSMRRRCPEMQEPDCAACPADPACAHRKELFQPVRRTTFY